MVDNLVERNVYTALIKTNVGNRLSVKPLNEWAD